MKIKVLKIYLKILYTNILANLFTWLLLASFIILLVTFSLICNSCALDDIRKARKAMFSTIQNVPFL